MALAFPLKQGSGRVAEYSQLRCQGDLIRTKARLMRTLIGLAVKPTIPPDSVHTVGRSSLIWRISARSATLGFPREFSATRRSCESLRAAGMPSSRSRFSWYSSTSTSCAKTRTIGTEQHVKCSNAGTRSR